MTATLPRTGQASELGRFIEANQQELTAAITAALGIGGPWAFVVGWIVGWIIDECLDPWQKNRQFRNQLLNANRQVVSNLTPVRHRTMPEIIEESLREQTVSVRATWDGAKVDVAPVVIPWTQTVTVSWNLLGHAASPCHQDVALMRLLGNDGGQMREFFGQDAEGVARLFQPESTPNSGQGTLHLPAGGYVLLAAVSGDHSTAEASVSYQTAQVKPEGIPVWPLALAAVWLMARRRRTR